MTLHIDKASLLRLVAVLEDEMEKAYLISPVPGAEVAQKHYEGWMACCRALRRTADSMGNGVLVSDEKLAVLMETIAESPTARDRFDYKISKLGEGK